MKEGTERQRHEEGKEGRKGGEKRKGKRRGKVSPMTQKLDISRE